MSQWTYIKPLCPQMTAPPPNPLLKKSAMLKSFQQSVSAKSSILLLLLLFRFSLPWNGAARWDPFWAFLAPEKLFWPGVPCTVRLSGLQFG